jgi:hypothetical protein
MLSLVGFQKQWSNKLSIAQPAYPFMGDRHKAPHVAFRFQSSA